MILKTQMLHLLEALHESCQLLAQEIAETMTVVGTAPDDKIRSIPADDRLELRCAGHFEEANLLARIRTLITSGETNDQEV